MQYKLLGKYSYDSGELFVGRGQRVSVAHYLWFENGLVF